MHIYTHMYVSTHIYIHIHTHTQTTCKCAQHKHVWVDCALSRHRAAQTTSDHLYWCETNPPDSWPFGLSVSPHPKPLQRCSATKIDVYSSASTGGIYPPASSPLSPAGIVPATRFVQPRCSPDEIHHPPPAGSLRRALSPISAASSSRREPIQPRRTPSPTQYPRLQAAVASPSGLEPLGRGPPRLCSKMDFTFLPFSRVLSM